VRKALIGTAATALAVGTSFMVAGPASAAPAACSGSSSSLYSDDGGAYVCWFPTGEIFKVCDTKSDGLSPGVKYKINNGSYKTTLFHSGYPTCNSINLDLPESDTVTYFGVNYKDSTLRSISSTGQVDTARG
jgi:hypothetical protein